MDSQLTPFFKPRGVVVVGASTSPEKLGYGVARNLTASGYTGAIHLVSQKTGELFGRVLYADLQNVPDPVDLAILIVPAAAMPDAVRICGRRGIRAAILVSAGFRETGAEGASLERTCVEIAHAHGIRLLGPNCIGLIDTHLPLDTTFLQPPMPAAGGIGFISHSGAFCAAIIDWSRQQSFGFSQIVSLGNQADVTETEMLQAVAEDGHTRVIALYMEGVSEGPAFVQAARQVVNRKPIVALKVGRFDAAQKAAASHTGALAGSDSAFDAAFKKAGIFRAESAEQMFDWAHALEVCPLPSGRRAAVLTDAGGPGVIATDALEKNALRLAELLPATRKALAAQLPPAANVHDPVDMLASASPDQYAACLSLLLEDPGVDSVLLILPPPPMYSAESVADAIIPVIQSSPKPTVIALMGSRGTAVASQHFSRAEIATYPFPERAAEALSILARRAEFILTLPSVATQPGRPFPKPDTALDAPPESLLAAYGITTLLPKLAHTPDEAATLAADLGFPVAMKISSPDISHKSDVGGVILNIKTAADARSGYTQVTRAAVAASPGARISGVTVQKQAPPGQEVIVGVFRDRTFGPLVMFGSGGVETEGLKDVAFALAPLATPEAEHLLQQTWAGRRLDGFRNLPPADKSAVVSALVCLSWLVWDHPELAEIEINPLRVLTRGAVAVDVRARH